MTKTVIEMWHKVWPDAGAFVRASAQDLERFAELVRADEREAIIQEIPGGHRLVCDLIRARNGGAA